MGIEDAVLISKQPVCQDGCHKVYCIENIYIDIRRDILFDKERQRGSYHRAGNKDNQTYDAVIYLIKAHKRADRCRVILRYRLIHTEYHCRANAEFGEVQHGQNGGKQTVESRIRHAERIYEQRAHNKRYRKIIYFRYGTEYQIAYCVF